MEVHTGLYDDGLWIACRAIHRTSVATADVALAVRGHLEDTRGVAQEPAPFSDQFARTAREEAARLAARAQEVRTRGEHWLRRAGDLLREADRLEQRVRELDELLGRAAQLRLDLQHRHLQGQRLREEATRILLARRGLLVAIHYREWFDLLVEEGLTVAGKDPVATFLTQINRSPVVVRVGENKGVYALDPHGSYERARTRLHEALAQQAAAEAGSDKAAIVAVDQARRVLETTLEARTNLLRYVITRPDAEPDRLLGGADPDGVRP